MSSWRRYLSSSRSRRGARPRFPRLLAIGLALAVVSTLVLWLIVTSTRADVASRAVVTPTASTLQVPARGEVAARFLDEGTPVFVVHGAGGDVKVVGARSPHDVTEKLVGWCPAGRMFLDVQHLSMFDERGEYLTGPAPTGLVPYEVVSRDRDAQTGTVRVGGPLAAPPRPTGEAAPHSRWERCWNDRADRARSEQFVSHRADAPAVTPEEAVALGNVDDVAVSGVWERMGSESAVLCGEPSDAPWDRCPAGAPRAASDVHDAAHPDFADSYLWAEGRFLLDVRGGRITGVTFTPDYTEEFGFFRGEWRYRGTLLAFDELHPDTATVIGDATPGEPTFWLTDWFGPHSRGRQDMPGMLYSVNQADVEVTTGDGETITTLPRLRAALADGELSDTPLLVRVSKASGEVTRIEQQPRP